MQSSDRGAGKDVSPDKGTGYYPMSDMDFDVINTLANKSKALQAYDKYIRDAQPNPELAKLFDQMKADDRKYVEELRKYLH